MMLHPKKADKHLSAKERKARLSGWRPEIEGRDEFLRANAPGIVKERDQAIVHLRDRVRKLESIRANYKITLKKQDAEIARLRTERDALLAEVERLKKLNGDQRISDAGFYTEMINQEIAKLAPFVAVARAAREAEALLVGEEVAVASRAWPHVVATKKRLRDALAHPAVQAALTKETT